MKNDPELQAEYYDIATTLAIALHFTPNNLMIKNLKLKQCWKVIRKRVVSKDLRLMFDVMSNARQPTLIFFGYVEHFGGECNVIY